MTLFEPDRHPQVGAQDALAIVHRFVEQCRAWAVDKEIPKRLQRLADDPDASEGARLQAWITYRDFLDHTLRELEDGTLDHWFTSEPPTPK